MIFGSSPRCNAPILDARIHPRTGASIVLSSSQRVVLWAVLAGAVALALWDWFISLCVINLLLSSLYFAAFAAKLVFMAKAARRDPRILVTKAELAAIRKQDLPIYTILLPMYHEAQVVPSLLRALESLDYPAEKLDIKFLLEDDDEKTRAAVDAADTRLPHEIVLAPTVGPRTKPRACNEGLARARGEFSVIYDAEDRPEPDQLLKAVAAFRRLPRHVACLQCTLDFYNRYQNWLTRQFTIEYAAWFELFLPGLHAAGLPIPLGGTSNHFRTVTLHAVGGWDPYNLTEDCELGMHLYAMGKRTCILDSTTWEEATSRLGPWVRQHSRWAKGYAQTFLVLMRHPRRMARRLGIRGMFGFLTVVGVFTLAQIVNPIYWIAGGMHLAIGWRIFYPDDRISLFFFVMAIILAAANLLFIAANLLAARRRGGGRFYGDALLSPICWILGSVAAWRGVGQLATRPFHWEKTPHGEMSGKSEKTRVGQSGANLVPTNSDHDETMAP